MKLYHCSLGRFSTCKYAVDKYEAREKAVDEYIKWNQYCKNDNYYENYENRNKSMFDEMRISN